MVCKLGYNLKHHEYKFILTRRDWIQRDNGPFSAHLWYSSYHQSAPLNYKTWYDGSLLHLLCKHPLIFTWYPDVPLEDFSLFPLPPQHPYPEGHFPGTHDEDQDNHRGLHINK